MKSVSSMLYEPKPHQWRGHNVLLFDDVNTCCFEPTPNGIRICESLPTTGTVTTIDTFEPVFRVERFREYYVKDADQNDPNIGNSRIVNALITDGNKAMTTLEFHQNVPFLNANICIGDLIQLEKFGTVARCVNGCQGPQTTNCRCRKKTNLVCEQFAVVPDASKLQAAIDQYNRGARGAAKKHSQQLRTLQNTDEKEKGDDEARLRKDKVKGNSIGSGDLPSLDDSSISDNSCLEEEDDSSFQDAIEYVQASYRQFEKELDTHLAATVGNQESQENLEISHSCSGGYSESILFSSESGASADLEDVLNFELDDLDINSIVPPEDIKLEQTKGVVPYDKYKSDTADETAALPEAQLNRQEDETQSVDPASAVEDKGDNPRHQVTEKGVSTLARMKFDFDNPDFRPILQVINIESVPGKDGSSSRCRANLSDGEFFIRGFMSGGMDLPGDGDACELCTNALIQLEAFMVQQMRGATNVIVLKFSLLENLGQRVGENLTDFDNAGT